MLFSGDQIIDKNVWTFSEYISQIKMTSPIGEKRDVEELTECDVSGK